MKMCTSCSNRPNIRINNLNYCNTCFQANFRKKVKKGLGSIRYGSRIVILIPKTVSEPYRRLFKDLVTLSADEVTFLTEEGGSRDYHSYLPPNLSKTDIFITCESLEDLIISSLEKLFLGDGYGAVSSLLPQSISGQALHLRPFSEISNKEISYWLYLEGMRMKRNPEGQSKMCQVIHEFLLEVQQKNSLVIFNISQALKKLASRRTD